MSSLWSGPISLSLFVPDVELDFATRFLNHFFICDETMASHLAVHLIFPGQNVSTSDNKDVKVSELLWPLKQPFL